MSWHYGDTELNQVALKIGVSVYVKCFSYSSYSILILRPYMEQVVWRMNGWSGIAGLDLMLSHDIVGLDVMLSFGELMGDCCLLVASLEQCWL